MSTRTTGSWVLAAVVVFAACSGNNPTTDVPTSDGPGPDACSGPACGPADNDHDGVPVGMDCDDNDPHVYPGVAATCRDACGDGWRRCGTDGAFGACSCMPLCEATSGGHCYYVAQMTGSDTNAGTFEAPWKSFANITSYATAAQRPTGWVELRAGDVVYFRAGTYRTTYMHTAGMSALRLTGVQGTAQGPVTLAAYPGARPVFSPDMPTAGIVIEQSNYVVVDGLEVRTAFGAGVRVAEGGHHEIRNVFVREVDGRAADNVAGVLATNVDHLDVHHSEIQGVSPNADLAEGNNHTSHDVLFLAGGNHHVHHNRFEHSTRSEPPIKRACVGYTTVATVAGATFEVDHNIFRECDNYTVGSATPGTRIHHNLMVNTGPMENVGRILIAALGGPAVNRDTAIENNTMVGLPAFEYNPATTPMPPGPFAFRRNIVADTGMYTVLRGMITISNVGDDALYDQVVTAHTLTFESNCYFNSATMPRFNLFAVNSGATNTRGQIYVLPGWQALGLDMDSAAADPQLEPPHYAPRNDACRARGWLAP
jgi:hypothetical protein